MNTVCIYHHNCADGFSAAWVVRRALGELVQFVPGVYQTMPPFEAVVDKDVIFVDFSYKRPMMEQIVERAKSVTVLDHHKTAEEDLRDLKGAKVTFDMNRSGATITWGHFFPNDPMPRLLAHIEDRDLWRFKLPGTREIQAAVFSYEYKFEIWDNMMQADTMNLFAQGVAIERKHHKDIAELVTAGKHRMKLLDYDVPAVNLPYIFSSDAGHLMAQGEPFAVCYWDTPEGRVFSLRSTDEGIDVSVVAKAYGGGGHRNAAGFRVPFLRAAELPPAAVSVAKG
jgi:oligoribonuclease NrnB/cAMP/cGMP phosphodiesterase (DHH superfamily)